MRASDDSAGYVVDTTYPARFHRELSPAWLHYVAVHGGAAPRRLDRPFRYLDLGCGFAHSTVINAAAFPHAELHACDFNAAHIETAARHAAALGVANLAFYASSFDELLTRELPPFDFIVLHGVYSWVAPEVRATIRNLIARTLAPDGLVYLSYNCLPGWSREAPLRKLMVELAAAAPGDGEQRAHAARASMTQLSQAPFKYFRDNPAAVTAIEAFTQEPASYLAHEFLNETWQLFYSIDVADELAPLGARFVGSATLADNHPPLLLDRASAEAVARLPTVRLQQLAIDFAVNQRFRRDVFAGPGQPRSTRDELARRVDDLVIGCVTDVEQIGAHAIIPRGKLTFHEDFVGELRALMTLGAQRVGELVARLGGAGRNAGEIRQNLIFLVAAGTLTPFAEAGLPAAIAAPAQLKPAIAQALRQIVATNGAAYLPSARVGSGVLVTAAEALPVTRWLDGQAAVDELPGRLRRLGLLDPSA